MNPSRQQFTTQSLEYLENIKKHLPKARHNTVLSSEKEKEFVAAIQIHQNPENLNLALYYLSENGVFFRYCDPTSIEIILRHSNLSAVIRTLRDFDPLLGTRKLTTLSLEQFHEALREGNKAATAPVSLPQQSAHALEQAGLFRSNSQSTTPSGTPPTSRTSSNSK